MKRTLIAIGSVLILALVVVLFVNAREGNKMVRKTATEATSCDPAACPEQPAAAVKEMKCCEPAASPENATAAVKESKCCEQATVAQPSTAAIKEMKECDPSACPGHATAAAGK